MDKKKIGAGFAGALQKAADATKAAKLAVQDMAADAKQSREKRKADAQKAAACANPAPDAPTSHLPPPSA